jgi:hypothetical protein
MRTRIWQGREVSGEPWPSPDREAAALLVDLELLGPWQREIGRVPGVRLGRRLALARPFPEPAGSSNQKNCRSSSGRSCSTPTASR